MLDAFTLEHNLTQFKTIAISKFKSRNSYEVPIYVQVIAISLLLNESAWIYS